MKQIVMIIKESISSARHNINFKHNAVIKGHIPLLMLRLSMLDGVLMLWMNLPVVNTIHPQIMCARFVGGVKIAATGDSKHCDSLTKQPRIEISCFSVQDIEYMYH